MVGVWRSAGVERRGTAATFAALTFASILMAINYRTFVEWGGLYPAGATGLSMLLQRIVQRFADAAGFGYVVPFSPINLALNAVSVWVGFRFIGRQFTLRSLYVIFMTGLFTDVLPIHALMSFISEGDLSRLATDPFQTSIFGGIVYIYSVCKKIDPSAFINTMSTPRVIGRFYLRPLD